MAGGLALVSHSEGDVLEPGAGWAVVRAAARSTLLQAPQSWAEPLNATAVPAPRWVVGEPQSPAQDWPSLLDDPEVYPIAFEPLVCGEVHDIDEWPRVADLQAVDFFCGRDPQDPTGEGVVSAFVALVQALVSYRTEHAESWCRVTVVTRGAAFDVQDPRGYGLWGAVRSMAIEVGEDAGIDFRLVDLGADDDLKTLASLARCDLRDREVAVRGGRLWVPRIESIRDHAPCVPAGDETTYRLCLDNPGQIGGLQMKTYEPAALGPGMVEVDVKAAALNFRDVMATLGLLPSAAYERSALGLEVGMEASGVVRRVGEGVDHCLARRRGDLHPGRMYRQSGSRRRPPRVFQACPPRHGASRVFALGLPHRVLCPRSPGSAVRRSERPHSLRHGRSGTGRHRACQARRGDDLRNGGKRGQA